MDLTKYSHSCVRLDDGDRSLVIDPGIWSEASAALDGTDAVLITHEHTDHFDVQALRSAAEANSALRIWAPGPVATALADLGDTVTAASPGESFHAGGFAVRTFGGQHALIHPSIPIVPNVGYLVDGTVFHPGDSFTVPTEPVQTLLLPSNAPWANVAGILDFMIAVRAPRAFQIHDALINELGTGLVEGLITRAGSTYGTDFRHLSPTETVSL